MRSGLNGWCISQLPIRQFTLQSTARARKRFSQLPIRQFTKGFRWSTLPAISQLPIRQFTTLEHVLNHANNIRQVR